MSEEKVKMMRMSTELDKSLWENCSEAVIGEVLSHLPVTTVAQLTFQSRLICNMVSCSYFRRLYYDRNAEAGDTLIARVNGDDNDHTIVLFKISSCTISSDLRFPFSSGEFSFEHNVRIIGCDAGIVCVLVYLVHHPDPPFHQIYLWNPITRLSKVIPSATLSYSYDGKLALGFGFDVKNSDFKILRILSNNSTAEVFSLHKNAWSNINSPSTLPHLTIDCVQGFLLAKSDSNGMMAFNLDTGNFASNITLPAGSDSPFVARFADRKDSIVVTMCMFKTSDFIFSLDNRVRIWELIDKACLCVVGVKASWTPLFDITLGSPVHVLGNLFNSDKLLFQTESDAIESYGVHIWCFADLNGKNVENLDTYFEPDEVFRFRESLFILDKEPSHPMASSVSGVTDSSSVQFMSTSEPVVSVDWLHSNLRDPDMKVLDASWYMPNEQRKPLKDYQVAHIPGALFFDVDGISDQATNLPRMLPSEDAFAAAVSALGIENKDGVVVYDGQGIFSAARVWWMFRVFGHDKIWVLDGGLPRWRASGFDVESSASGDASAASAVAKVYQRQAVTPLTFEARIQPHLVWNLDQVKKNIEENSHQLIDASKARFDGTASEPRKGIRTGHIPGSKCIPFPQVLDSSQSLLPPSNLKEKFEQEGISLDKPIVTSCGTGVAACILALGLHRLGKTDVPVYDGSWTEWGAHPDTPVSTSESS